MRRVGELEVNFIGYGLLLTRILLIIGWISLGVVMSSIKLLNWTQFNFLKQTTLNFVAKENVVSL